MPARRILGAALLAAGSTDEGVVELRSAVGPDKEDAISLSWLAHAQAIAGAREEARAIVATLESAARNAYVPHYHLALAHAGLGNRDAAFALLDQACAEREPAVVNLKVEPRFEPLRRDPRYEGLLHRLRL
jgi:predicted Zn-dependent protease